MAGARSTPVWACGISLAALFAALAVAGSTAFGQSVLEHARPVTRSPGPLFPDPDSLHRSAAPRSPGMPADARPVDRSDGNDREQVVDVRILGNGAIPLQKILPHVHTRAGRPFSAELIEEDVRRLSRTQMFIHVKPYYQQVEGGRVVIFEVVERPMLHYVKYVGNEKIKKQKLEKEAGIKAGDSMDVFAVEEARRRLESYYHSHGFSKARVTIAEGNKPNDRGVVFVINEGPKQRVLWTDFVGNTIASDARLRTLIQSKPGFLWVFKGELDPKQVDEDLNRLTAYYRSLGFFRAYVGRELHFTEDQSWVTITFVIDEGPRYKVRNVSFIGNGKFSTEELAAQVKLRAGQYFNQSQMQADVNAIQDAYGGIGYIFADVQADPRFLEEPGQLDLVYNIREGEQFRVGKINVQIKGEFPHTRITTILNRMSIHPGDIVDIRELRASERRLRASGLFEVDPANGTVPKIVFSPPDPESLIARKRPGNVRGQSPDPPVITVQEAPRDAVHNPRSRLLDLTIQGHWIGGPEREPATDAAVPAASPDDSLRQAHSSLRWLLETSEARLEPAPVDRASAPVVPVHRGVAPAAPAPTNPTNPTNPAPAAPLPDVPLRGDFGGPAGPCIIRGQYSPNAGWSVPSLRRGSIWNSPSSASYTSGTSQPSQTVPPPSSTTLASPPYTAGTASSPAPAQAPQPYPATSPAQPAPSYASPPGTQPFAPPIDVYSVPQAGIGGPTATDAETLLGTPPDEVPLPPLYIPLEPLVTEARTGRLMFSVGVNSEAGLLGSIIIDEQNFDITRFPRSLEDIRNGVAFRGAGQRFRAEAVPGTELQRYTVSFQEPYLLDTNVSLSLSGYYYDRRFREWTEQRVGGRVALGYQFTPDLSGSLAFRGASIDVFDPIIPTPPQLAEALGENSLYGFQAQLTLDTRDSPFLPTEGSLIEASVEQVVGTFDYPRVELDLRRYFLLAQRPDGSGRQVLSLSSRAAYTGDETPIYEHYFAGGFSTIRGFDFRGASPTELGVFVGGEFMLLASAEYMFPITADDMIRGVVFVDTGTVQPEIDEWTNRYRVAPGFGLRITIPAMGPAPIAIDLAFPISHEPGDDIENFSFFVGFFR